MNDLIQILNLLFDKEDTVAVSNGPYSYHSIPQDAILSGEVTLVSQNTDIKNKTIKTVELTHLCINACKGFRADSSITKFRTFLLEIDTGTLQSQFNYIKSLNIPYSCTIFSGSKSLHTAIVLEEPIKDEKLYRYFYKWILNVAALCDQQVKNPSRCIRFPGNIRPETGKEQKLLQLKSRIKIEDLLNWLKKYPECKPKIREKKALTNGGNFAKLSLWVKEIMKTGNINYEGGRNRRWYSLFCNFANAGYSMEESITILEKFFQEESDFRKKEWLTCAKSAFEHVLKN